MSCQCRHGSHVSLQQSLYQTVAVTPSRCLQLYISPRQQYSKRNFETSDINATIQLCQDQDRTIYVHAPLVTNLAKDITDAKSLDITNKSIKVICESLWEIRDLPAAYVLHIGRTTEHGSLQNVAERINAIKSHGFIMRKHHDRMPYNLLLENAAGQGTELGVDIDQLRKLYEAVDYTQVGLCIDTQHSFGAGLCDFSSHESVVKLFDSIESVTNAGISMLHLNDSCVPFGKRVDRHAPLMTGHIWSDSAHHEGLKSLLYLATEKQIDLVTETSDSVSDARIVDMFTSQYHNQSSPL